MKRALAALGATLAMLTLAEAEELKCEIREKFVCEPGAACKPSPVGVWNIIDTAKRTYARCDTRSCDTYEARFSQSGIFINIEVPGRGVIAKMSMDGSAAFHEVATLGHSVLISFGACKRTS